MKKIREVIHFQLLGVILAITAFLVVVQIFKINNSITNFESSNLATVKFLAGNLKGVIESRSEKEFNSILYEMNLATKYRSMNLRDNHGHTVISTGKKIHKNLDRVLNDSLMTIDYIYYNISISTKNSTVGSLEVKLSTVDLANDIKNDLAYFIITIFGIILFSLYVARKISNEISKPIHKLNSDIKRILASDDLTVRATNEYQIYETHELSSSFNELISTLENSRVDLNLMNKSLENLVTEKTKKMRLALEDMKKFQDQLVAQEKLASLGSLTAGIAHEIKNPLNLIINSAQIVHVFTRSSNKIIDKIKLSKINEINLEEFEDDLSDLNMAATIITDNSFRADRIIKSMLSQSRTQDSVLINSNIGLVLEQALNLSIHAMKAKFDLLDVKITKFIPHDLSINCYPDDLERAFINILDNSLHAMKLKSQKDENYSAHLEILLESRGHETVVHITDNGVGLSKELQLKVFEPFFTTKPSGEGTGLGMGMVADIITAHNGKIELSSKLNEYTKLSVSLSNSLKEKNKEKS
jgi:signal transduction histidine kinase